MTNDEIRTGEATSAPHHSSFELRHFPARRDHSNFVIRHSFLILISSFVIPAACSRGLVFARRN
jgi:hypothetical protein